MLDIFRSITQTWIGRILGVFLIIGLAGFGISNVLGTLGSNTIATAAGTDISARDFQRAYQNQLNGFLQQNGRMPTNEEAMAAGIPVVVIQQLAAQASINKYARTLGIGVSDKKLGDMIKQDPNFGDILGNVTRDNFKAVLQNSGFTEKEYFDLQRDAARRQQLLAGLTGDSPTPNAALELVTRYAGDKRTVDYFVLSTTSLPPVADPTEDELAAYLKDHQTEFRTKETRSVDIMVLSPDTLAATKTVAEDKIAAEYEATKAQRVTAEKRDIKQVALTTPELEKAFTDGKAAGTPVSQIVIAAAAAPQDLGTRAKSEVTDASLAEAAFGLASTDDVAIIDGIGGKKRAIFVSEIQPSKTATLAEAHDEIAKKLATDQARTEIADMLDQVEELRAAFKPLSEIAQRFNLKLQTIALTPGGPELTGDTDVPEDARANVAAAVFKAEQGSLTAAVSLGSNRNVWFDLKSVEPARDQTLAEVHDAVSAAWTAQKQSEALTAEVAVTLDKLRAGTSFEDAAAAVNQYPTPSLPMDRNGDGTPVINQQVASAIFDGGPDHFGAALNGDGDQVVFKVVDVTPATDPAANIKTFVANSITDGLDSDFQRGLLATSGYKINEAALMNLLSLNSPAQ
jgi:peptidyl-prolyl cis-trans isomerase D